MAANVEDVETNLLYMMQEASMMLIWDIERRLGQKKERFRHEKKQLFTRFISLSRQLAVIDSQLFDDVAISANGNTEKYDNWLEEVNELCRLLLTFADKCSTRPDSARKVFDLMESFEGSGIVAKEDIERFRMK